MIHWNTDARSEASSLASAASEGFVCLLFASWVLSPRHGSRGGTVCVWSWRIPWFLTFSFLFVPCGKTTMPKSGWAVPASSVRSSVPLLRQNRFLFYFILPEHLHLLLLELSFEFMQVFPSKNRLLKWIQPVYVLVILDRWIRSTWKELYLLKCFLFK